MTKPRGGTLAFLTVVGLATGAAFAAGSHLRARYVDYLQRRPSMQLAQAKPDGAGFRPARPQPQDRGRRGRNAGQADEVGLEPLQIFYQVYDLVKDNYVDKLPEERKMAHGAVRGMLAELNDPNSRFLEPAEREAMENEARGRFAGIGAALSVLGQKRDGYTEHKIVVVAPLPGSPAEKAGLKPGDVITHVDGKWVLGSNPAIQVNKMIKRVQSRDATEEELEKAMEAAQERIKGGITLNAAQRKLAVGQGEKRAVTIQRSGAAGPIKLGMTTAVTEVDPVIAKTLPGGIGYIRLAAFTEKAAAEFKEELARLPKQPGLVLDLRGNPGGLLEPVKQIAGELTRGGSLLVAVGPGGKRDTLAAPAAGRPARPIVVLMDKGTASSAEALAAVLRDKKAGVLVGGKTFGDALVTTLYTLPDGSAYTLTTGKLLAPAGGDWQTAGLAPSVALAGGIPEAQVIAKAVSVLKDRAHVAALPKR